MTHGGRAPAAATTARVTQRGGGWRRHRLRKRTRGGRGTGGKMGQAWTPCHPQTDNMPKTRIEPSQPPRPTTRELMEPYMLISIRYPQIPQVKQSFNWVQPHTLTTASP